MSHSMESPKSSAIRPTSGRPAFPARTAAGHGITLLIANRHWTRPLLAAVLLATWTSARGADWPQWGGRDGRNMVSQEKGLPSHFVPGSKRSDGSGIDLATTRNVCWVARLGTETLGNATVADGRVFIGTNDVHLGDPRLRSSGGGCLKCFDCQTGKLLWQLVVPRKIVPREEVKFDHMDLGICSSPTVDGDCVYVVSNRGELLCLDVRGLADGNQGAFQEEMAYQAGLIAPQPGNATRPTSGRSVLPAGTTASHGATSLTAKSHASLAAGPTDPDILWRYDMMAELAVWPHDAANCSVLVHGDYVYAGTSNGVDRTPARKAPSPLAPSLIVLDKRSGRLVAQDGERMGTRVFHGQWSSPSLGVVNGRTLVFFGGGDGVCYAFAAVERSYDRPVLLEKVWQYDCNPPHYKERDGRPIDYWTGDARFSKVNKDDGQFVGPSEIIGTPAFCDNRVYVTTGQDPLHGRGRAVLQVIDATGRGDISASGRVWSFEGIDRSMSTPSISGGLVYVADWTGRIFCLDARKGQVLWTHDTKAETWGSTLVADGKLYLGTKKSLWILAAGPEKQVLSEIRLGAACWCTPIAADGTLYVSSDRYLWAVRDTSRSTLAHD